MISINDMDQQSLTFAKLKYRKVSYRWMSNSVLDYEMIGTEIYYFDEELLTTCGIVLGFKSHPDDSLFSKVILGIV